MLSLARLAVGLSLAALAGGSFLPWPARIRGEALDGLALSITLGLALMTPPILLVGLLGLPMTEATILTVAVVVAFAGRRFRTAGSPAEPAGSDDGSLSLWSSRLVLLGAFAAFCLKIARVPVWSWDHHLVWGMKARRLLEGGFLNLEFLNVLPFSKGNPEYPLGLPLLWRILTLGAEPAPRDFKALHVLTGLAVVCLIRLILRHAGASRVTGNAVAAFVAVSPLFWDTESLGLADMPLCAASLAGLYLLLRLRDGSDSRWGWLAGVLLGFLPWIKKEGFWLALLLLCAGGVIARGQGRRRLAGWAAAAIPFSILAAGALLFQKVALPSGLPFLAGHWWWRVKIRAPHALRIPQAMGANLLASDWLGFWLAAPLLLAHALWKRAYDTLAVAAVVLGQLLLYAFTYLATYVEPFAHIETSFFRLAAALLPLAAVGFALPHRSAKTTAQDSSPA